MKEFLLQLGNCLRYLTQNCENQYYSYHSFHYSRYNQTKYSWRFKTGKQLFYIIIFVPTSYYLTGLKIKIRDFFDAPEKRSKIEKKNILHFERINRNLRNASNNTRVLIPYQVQEKLETQRTGFQAFFSTLDTPVQRKRSKM